MLRRVTNGWVLLAIASLGVIALVPAAPQAGRGDTFVQPQVTPIDVGPEMVAVSNATRDAKGLTAWPDGSLGVLPPDRNGNYRFFASNGSCTSGATGVAATTGTMADPAAGVSVVRAVIQGAVNADGVPYNYAGGGPVYDTGTGTLLMLYHGEIWKSTAECGTGTFYSSLNLAKSTDGGRTWKSVGELVRPNASRTDCTTNAGPENGSLLVRQDGGVNYFYIYDQDYVTVQGGAPCTEVPLMVARVPVDQVVAWAAGGPAPEVRKYYDGGWTQPGIGGMSSSLLPASSNFEPWHWSMTYNDYLGEYLGFAAGNANYDGTPDLYFSESVDGLHFSDPRIIVDTAGGETTYPTVVGEGSDPTHSGRRFDLFYFESPGDNGWTSMFLAHRIITLAPPGAVIYKASTGFAGPPQGQNGWSYSTASGSTYAPMTWSTSDNRWEGTIGAEEWITADQMMPGLDDVVRSWEAPAAGVATVSGFDQFLAPAGDGDLFSILQADPGQHEVTLWSVPSPQPDADKPVPFQVTVHVQAGTMIRFRLAENPLALPCCNQAEWDPWVVFVPATAAPERVSR